MANDCKNCMWGDKCPNPETCGFYDPLEDDDIGQACRKRSFDEEWRRYVHGQHNEPKAVEIRKLFH